MEACPTPPVPKPGPSTVIISVSVTCTTPVDASHDRSAGFSATATCLAGHRPIGLYCQRCQTTFYAPGIGGRSVGMESDGPAVHGGGRGVPGAGARVAGGAH